MAEQTAALNASEPRFRSLAEMSSDFYWETDAGHRLKAREADIAKRSMVPGFDQGAQIGKRRWEIPHLSPDETGWQAHQATLDAHLPFRSFEISRLGTDGSERHLSISGDPVFDAAGAFEGYRGVGADISERKRAEQTILNEKSFTEKLIASLPDVFFLLDPTGRFVRWNRQAGGAARRLRCGDVRINALDVMHDGDRPLVAERIKDAFAQGDATVEARLVTKTGPRDYIFIGRQIDSAQGANVIGIGIDVTERNRSALALKLFRTLLDHAGDAIEIIDPEEPALSRLQ